MANPFQVIVTRPSPYGEALCDQLEAQGFRSHHCPLIDFSADEGGNLGTRLELLSNCSSWIFVSRQAVNYCFSPLSEQQLQTLLHLSQNKHLIAVGPSTAEALSALGFNAMTPETPDSEGMIALLKKHQLQEQPTCLIRGNQGRQLLQNFFTDDTLKILQVYQRKETSCNIPSLNQPSAIVVTSGQLLLLAHAQISKQSPPSSPVIIAGSERIANKARQLGYTNCYTANSAANSDLIKACILWRNNVS